MALPTHARPALIRRLGLALRRVSPVTLRLILLAVVLWYVCLSGLGAFDFIDLVDEGTYADAARRMIDSGDWVTPRVGQEILWEKPPLLYWCQIPFIRILGATPLAARLPSALAALATAIILYCWARRRGLERVGWLAAMLYALTPLLAIGMARLAMTDSLLTLWFTLAIVGWISGQSGDRKGYWLMAAAMGLATMTKGVIGFMLPMLAFGVWVTLRRDWAELRRLPWAAMAGIFLALALPWHLAAWRANGKVFVDEYVIHLHLQRFFGNDVVRDQPLWWHNRPYWHYQDRPFWYFVPVTALFMIPWTIFAPQAWWRGLRARLGERQAVESAMLIWAVWAAITFLFFSASRAKLPHYILPAMPAFMLLVARRLDSAWSARRGLTALETAAFLTVTLLLGTLSVIIGFSALGWRSHPSPSLLARTAGKLAHWDESYGVDALWQKLDIVTSLAPYWIGLGAFLLALSVAILFYRRETAKTIGFAIAMSLALIVVGAHVALARWAGNTGPLAELGRRALPALERGEPLILFGLHANHDSLRYLLGHDQQIYQTSSPDELESLLEGAGGGWVITEQGALLPPFPGTAQEEEAAAAWRLWQVHYHAFTVEDLRAMLAEDSRLRLWPESVRRVIEALIRFDNSWPEAAQALNITPYAIQEKLNQAVLEYGRRKADGDYQPDKILRHREKTK